MNQFFKRTVSSIMSIVMAVTLKASTPSSIEKREPERGKAVQIITSSIQNLKDNSGLPRGLEISTIPGYHSLLDTIRPKASSEDIEALLTKLQVYSTNNLTTDIIHNGLELITNLSDCDYEYDGNIDSIIDNIRKNTKSFVEENPQYCPALITRYSKEEIKKNKLKSKKGDCVMYAVDYQKDLPYIYDSQKEIDRIFKSCLETFFNNNPSFINNGVANYISDFNFLIFYSMTEEEQGVMGYLDSTNLVILPDNIKLIIEESNISFEEAVTILINNALNNIKARLLARNSVKAQFENDLSRFNIENDNKPFTDIPNIQDDDKKFLSCLEAENLNKVMSSDEENELRQLLLLNGPNNMVSFEELRAAFLNKDISSVYKLLGVKSINDVYTVNQTIGAIASRCGKDSIFNDFVILNTKVIPNEDKVHKFANYLDNMLEYINTNPNLTLEDVATAFLTLKCHLVRDLHSLIPEGETTNYKTVYNLEIAKKIIQMENVAAMAITDRFGITIAEFRKTEICGKTLRTFMAICDMHGEFDYGDDIEDCYYNNACLICDKFPILETILSTSSDDLPTPLTPCDWDFYIRAIEKATSQKVESEINDNSNSSEIIDEQRPSYKFEFTPLVIPVGDNSRDLVFEIPSQSQEERAAHLELVNTRMQNRNHPLKLEKKKSPYLRILKEKISHMSLVKKKPTLPWKKAA